MRIALNFYVDPDSSVMKFAQKMLPTQIVESALFVAGIRVGTEHPHYASTPLTDEVDIRKYGPRLAAETTVAADEERARNVGFQRLALYIFGANHRDQQFAKDAPAVQKPDRKGDEIAMTAPVAQYQTPDDRWTIRFFMPSKWTLETLPTPDDDTVSLVSVPAETVAVLRFTGDRSPVAVASRTDELLDTLRSAGITPIGNPVAWFYDPPWTLPFRRRNEIAIPVRT